MANPTMYEEPINFVRIMMCDIIVQCMHNHCLSPTLVKGGGGGVSPPKMQDLHGQPTS